MKNWFLSIKGAVTLSVISLLMFLGRAFMDWRYEYPLQDPAGNWDIPGALVYMALAGGWIWGILAAERGSRRGLITILIFALLLNVALSLATYFLFCPPWTDCEGWPNVWWWNWTNLVIGILAVISITFQLRKSRTLS
jgi:hypothetical protein